MSKKRKLLYFCALPAFALCFIFLAGCSNHANETLDNIVSNASTVSNTINEIQIINNNELIIEDFMSNEELEKIDIENGPTLYNKPLTTYITRLTLLNNSIYNAVQVNNDINNVRKQILAKAQQVKVLAIKSKEEKNIKTSDLDILEEINGNISANNTRLALSRNEVNSNLKTIREIQDDYSKKTEMLCSRYVKLEGSFNMRLSYMKNILNGFENLEQLLTNSSETNFSFDDAITTSSSLNNSKKHKTIDSYNNARRIKRSVNKSNENYLNNGLNNHFYPYNSPYYYAPYGGMYNFGSGFPFGNGFRFPNINTYGAYKNIDTYKLPNQTEIIDTSTRETIIEDLNTNYHGRVKIYYEIISPDGETEKVFDKTFEFNFDGSFADTPKTLEEPIVEDNNSEEIINTNAMQICKYVPESWRKPIQKPSEDGDVYVSKPCC